MHGHITFLTLVLWLIGLCCEREKRNNLEKISSKEWGRERSIDSIWIQWEKKGVKCGQGARRNVCFMFISSKYCVTCLIINWKKMKSMKHFFNRVNTWNTHFLFIWILREIFSLALPPFIYLSWFDFYLISHLIPSCVKEVIEIVV